MEEHGTDNEFAGMSAAGKAAILRARKRRASRGSGTGADTARGISAADFRPEAEDDDGYDPYSDYMDALNRSELEEPSEDPWR